MTSPLGESKPTGCSPQPLTGAEWEAVRPVLSQGTVFSTPATPDIWRVHWCLWKQWFSLNPLKKKKKSQPYVALALLPECPSVLLHVCVVTCLHLVLFALQSHSPAGSLQPSDPRLLPLLWLWLLFPHLWRFQRHVLSPPCRAKTLPCTPASRLASGSPSSHPSHTWSTTRLFHTPESESLSPWKEYLPIGGGEARRWRKRWEKLDYGIRRGRRVAG